MMGHGSHSHNLQPVTAALVQPSRVLQNQQNLQNQQKLQNQQNLQNQQKLHDEDDQSVPVCHTQGQIVFTLLYDALSSCSSEVW